MNIVDLNDNLELITNYLSIKQILHLAQTCKYFNNYTKIIKKKRKITKCNYYKIKQVIDNWRMLHTKLTHKRKNINSWRSKFRDPEREILLF